MQTKMQTLSAVNHAFVRRVSFWLLISLAVWLSACKKEDAVPVAPFEGKYTVQETDPSDNYTLTIERQGGNAFLIHNFGDFMRTAVKANGNGNILTIPSQTFTNASSGRSITISGTLEHKGNTLDFEYAVSGFAGNYSRKVQAVKK